MVDIRQVAANNIYLTQLAEAQDKLGDSLIKAIDSEVTLPLRIRASAYVAPAPTLLQDYTAGYAASSGRYRNIVANGYGDLGTWMISKIAQPFTLSSSVGLSSISIAMSRDNTALAGYVKISIYSNGASKPGSVLFSSSDVLAQSITTTSAPSLVNFQFASQNLTAGTQYWLVLEPSTGFVDTVGHLKVHSLGDGSTPPAGSLKMWADVQADWFSWGSDDLFFQIYGLGSSNSQLTVNIDSIKVTNPEHSRNKTIAPVSNILPNFTGGTITLPALGSGNITNSTGSPAIPLNLSGSNYVKVGVNINTSGQIIPSLGTMHSVASEFGYMPPVPSGCRAAGHFVVYCDSSGNVQGVQNSAIWQYAYAVSSGGEGAVFERVGATITAGPYNVTQEDCIIRVNTASSLSNVVINLPAAASTQLGRKLIIKDIGGKVSMLNKGIVLTPNGSDTIEGETSIKMDMDKMSLTLICGGDGTWMIV
jgi:hypothetical protein